MQSSELEIRAIKDKIAAVIGEMDEASSAPQLKPNRARLSRASRELHKCADEIQNILMRLKIR